MRKLLLLILSVILLTGCNLGYDIYPRHPNKVLVYSKDIFTIQGIPYVETIKNVPVTIYNPNKYTIQVDCGKQRLTIPGYGSVTSTGYYPLIPR